MADIVHVKGLDQLQKFLDTLAPKVERNVMRGALRAGANVVKQVAQTNIQSVFVELAKIVRVSVLTRRCTVTAAAKTYLFFERQVEYGTSPPLIR